MFLPLRLRQNKLKISYKNKQMTIFSEVRTEPAHKALYYKVLDLGMNSYTASVISSKLEGLSMAKRLHIEFYI
jgi:hypothetical protein